MIPKITLLIDQGALNDNQLNTIEDDFAESFIEVHSASGCEDQDEEELSNQSQLFLSINIADFVQEYM